VTEGGARGSWGRRYEWKGVFFVHGMRETNKNRFWSRSHDNTAVNHGSRGTSKGVSITKTSMDGQCAEKLISVASSANCDI